MYIEYIYIYNENKIVVYILIYLKLWYGIIYFFILIRLLLIVNNLRYVI